MTFFIAPKNISFTVIVLCWRPKFKLQILQVANSAKSALFCSFYHRRSFKQNNSQHVTFTLLASYLCCILPLSLMWLVIFLPLLSALLFSLREEVHQSRWGGGTGDPVQTVQSQQRLRPLQADRCPPQQEGEQPEQEQPVSTGAHTWHSEHSWSRCSQ